jgi:tetratricopeptide (TPR) repeat protein
MTATTSHGNPALRWGGLVLVAIAALWGLDRLRQAPPAPELHVWADSPYSARSIARTYAEALSDADAEIATAAAEVAAFPDQWLRHETLALHYLARAQLSGSYDDYATADAALNRAFELAPKGAGPHMVRARLDFAMHRLPGADRALAAIEAYAVPPVPAEQADIDAMRGDIRFYSGRMDEALALYDRADRVAPGITLFRRAIHAARTGGVERADRLFARAIAAAPAASPQLRAYLELQRGILDLDRRRLDDAMAHFRAADGFFPGHWLIEEHIAEVLTLQGRDEAAERLYRDIVRRTGHPEFIDALAAIAERRGDSAAAQRLHAEAGAKWARRLQQFPEAAYGHAIDHCIAIHDTACQLRLAEQNYQARPFGEAGIALAEALNANGRTVDARAIIERVKASGWRTPELDRVAADIAVATAADMTPS